MVIKLTLSQQQQQKNCNRNGESQQRIGKRVDEGLECSLKCRVVFRIAFDWHVDCWQSTRQLEAFRLHFQFILA